MHLTSRRQFLTGAAPAATMMGLGGLGFLSRLPRISAAETRLEPEAVRFSPDIEPLVRFIEETPRTRLIEDAAVKVRDGLSYRDLLTALFLAGIRNVQPRPVGFKFHAVLVVNSAHLASLAARDSDRWLPVFWALDYFKSSQARDEAEGDWTMQAVEESRVPPSHRARRLFIEAMEQWDEEKADSAVTGLARSAGSQELFDLFSRFGARDFREIGHKAIYVANSWRTLQCIGWRHAEPVLRSLAYALLDRLNDPNPAGSDLPADRPGRRNMELTRQIRADWLDGRIDSEATLELVGLFREGSALDASRKTLELLNRGVSPRSVWDAVFAGAGELLMRASGIRSLHAVTTANALHYEGLHGSSDGTRRYLLLQAAAFAPLFRGNRPDAGVRIDELDPLPVPADPRTAADAIFGELRADPLSAARRVLSYSTNHPDTAEFMDAARALIFLKGTDSHDYKFSSAVLEDHACLSGDWRHRFLAASVFNFKGSESADNGLAPRIRAALKTG